MKKLKNKIILLLLKVFSIFFKKRISFDSKNPKILIVSTTALGDSLWTTPILKTIKKNYKNAYIGCLCSEISYKIFRNSPYADKLFLLKKPFLINIFSLFRKLKKEKFQMILVMHTSQRIVLPLCYLLNAEIFSGSTKINKGLDILFTKRVENKHINSHDSGHYENRDSGLDGCHDSGHEIDRRFNILKNNLKIEKYFYDINFKIIKKSVLSSLENIINQNIIAFHPGASTQNRMWPKEYFVQLGKTLQKKYKVKIILTGSIKEKKLIEEISKEIGDAEIFFNLSIENLAFLYKNCRLVISGDTGPYHLALSQNVKTLGIYGPTNPKDCGPYKNPKGFFIYRKRPCKTCLKTQCKYDKNCLHRILPVEVEKKIADILIKN